jgi:hypothetical protein
MSNCGWAVRDRIRCFVRLAMRCGMIFWRDHARELHSRRDLEASPSHTSLEVRVKHLTVSSLFGCVCPPAPSCRPGGGAVEPWRAGPGCARGLSPAPRPAARAVRFNEFLVRTDRFAQSRERAEPGRRDVTSRLVAPLSFAYL